MTTEEVNKLTGATLRQLQHWTETGLIPVKTKGHRREWTPENLRRTDIILLLRRKGLSIQKIHRIKNALAKQPSSYLVTDGKEACSSIFASTILDWAIRRQHSVVIIEIPERRTE